MEIVVGPIDSQEIFFFFFFGCRAFLRPLGIYVATLFPVRALYLEPHTRPYEICIYHHLSFALSVELPVSSGLQDPQQLLVRPA